jgi:hypothetical protein
VQNLSSRHLHISIVDLQPDWAIDSLVPDAPELAPGQTREFALHASLNDARFATGREVMKVLATVDPVDPGLLKLPALGLPYLPTGPRGHGESALDELFRILQEPLVGTRRLEFARAPSSGWTVAHTEIEIYCPQAALAVAGG